jgi:N-acetyl-alpha-D-muramate 1-phosphate uridylyltransferase
MLPIAILAGGLATRMRPLTTTLPKALLEVNGEPFAAHQLRLLAKHGIHRVVYCTGFLGEMIEEFVGDGSRFGVQVSYLPDGDKLLGTGGAIKRTLPLLGEQFFVTYGDSYLPCDYRAVATSFQKSGQAGLMTVYRNEGLYDTSNVVFEDGRLLIYDKKLRSPSMRHIDYGLSVFHRRAFDHVPTGEVVDLASVFQRLLADGELAGFEVPERFYEIGSFSGLDETGQYLRNAA